MIHEVPGTNPDSEAKIDNVQVRLIVGAHYVDSASGFATVRKNIEHAGISHFRRSFTNILFLEEASGSLSKAFERLNEDALRLRSWRRAFWATTLDMDDEKTDSWVRTVDSNVLNVFDLLKRKVGPGLMDDWEFNYAVFSAMDGIKRKGIDLILAAEQPGEVRTSAVKELEDQSLDEMEADKKGAVAARAGDIGMAKDIKELVRKHPQKTRILGIMGATHVRVRNYLPEELGEVEVSYFNGDESNIIVQRIFDYQDGKLSDEDRVSIGNATKRSGA